MHEALTRVYLNSGIFHLIRNSKHLWLCGDIHEFTENGIKLNRSAQGVPKNGPGHKFIVEGDTVIMATGYSAQVSLPADVFHELYQPPNWYLQVFPPYHISIAAPNSTYQNAVGTVRNYHVGIYTRLLLVFLVDPL